MAKSAGTMDLFKNLPKSTKAHTKTVTGAGGPLSAAGGPSPRDNPVEGSTTGDPGEFPLGEYPKAPSVIEELPQPPEPPTASGSPPPEESIPEVEPEPEPVGPEDQEPIEGEEVEEEIPALPPSAAAATMTQIEMLKNRARLMGIQFSNNIGLEALKTKIEARLEGDKGREAAENLKNATPKSQQMLPVKTDRQLMYEQEMRLVRLRITNLDPKKKDLPGEIFTVANRVIGAVKKFIPYGEATDNGYHVPYVIYRQLKEREFLNIKTRKDRQGRTIVETGMAREFALEELPPLTQLELNRLAASQAAAAGMSN